MNIYVGNLSSAVIEQDLRDLFSGYGNIIRTKIVRDPYTGVSKGFGFVEMPGESEARKAIKELDTKDIKGKKITVSEAHGGKSDNRSPNAGRRNCGGRLNHLQVILSAKHIAQVLLCFRTR